MVRTIDIMKRKEEEIARLIELISEKSHGFTKPKVIIIGGYALRAFIPFSRYTRDCDFVLKKKNGWNLDLVKTWLPKDVKIETLEKRDNYGFIRSIKILRIDKKTAKVSLDFMEGQVAGRTKEQVVMIDDNFINNSLATKIDVSGKELEVFVPCYKDYLIMKIVSSRPSDIRDVAALIWKNGVPKDLKERSKEILPYTQVLKKNVEEIIIPTISDKRFLNSWRGTFLTMDFTEEIKKGVLKEIQKSFII